jgi:uncharacterized membrane protein AbrB (regulator of aidB expression)
MRMAPDYFLAAATPASAISGEPGLRQLRRHLQREPVNWSGVTVTVLLVLALVAAGGWLLWRYGQEPR